MVNSCTFNRASLSLLKEEPFVGPNRAHPNCSDLLLEACRRVGFKLVKQTDGVIVRSRYPNGVLHIVQDLGEILDCFGPRTLSIHTSWQTYDNDQPYGQ